MLNNLYRIGELLASHYNHLLKICSHWGHEYMTTVAMEECAELTQCISKLKRYGRKKELKNHLSEEIADVLICIAELKVMGYWKIGDVEEQINRKIDRSLKRIETGGRDDGTGE
mgnify:CR=1 FL=1